MSDIERYDRIHEKICRAMCEFRGIDPDKMRNPIGRSEDSETWIPSWHMEKEWADRFMAAMTVFIEEAKP